MSASHDPDQVRREQDRNDVEALLDEALDQIVGGLGEPLPWDEEELRTKDDAAKPIKFI